MSDAAGDERRVDSQTERANETFSIGTIVRDIEDSDPDDAVVINRPPAACEDWFAYTSDDGTKVTVADDNPSYDPKADVIVVAFLSTLEEQHPDWTPSDGPIRLSGDGISSWGFPPGCLEQVGYYGDAHQSEGRQTQSDNSSETPDEDSNQGASEKEASPPPLTEEQSILRERFEQKAEVEVRADDGVPVLVVSKLGEEYFIDTDLTVSGQGVLRDRIKQIINQEME